MHHAIADPADRLAAIAVLTLKRTMAQEQRMPAAEDFARDFRKHVDLEILIARLRAVRVPHAERDAYAKAIIAELAKVGRNER
jgi:hypothetical protein